MNLSTGSMPTSDSGCNPYFSHYTLPKAMLYGFAAVYVISVAFVSIFEPFMNIKCQDPGTELDFENPSYDGSQCPHIRYAVLLFLTKQECSFGRRLVFSVIFGGLIGWERREADRPAGIRTMSLVSLGSCLFSINSAFAFLTGPMAWDASRVSAAIPSGVGFLGAGLIFKKELKNEDGDSSHVVHGLTTATSLWLSAAVGIACGGELYLPASLCVAIMMLLLRFGPRGSDETKEDEEDEEDDENEDGIGKLEKPLTELTPMMGGGGAGSYHTGAATAQEANASIRNLRDHHRQSIRKRQAALGSIV